MIYRTLGKTNLQVSILGFGASPLGNEFGQIDPAEGSRAVHYAIEQGVNYFDVSPYYGRTLAETRLGQALAGCRDKVILATKVGRYDKDLQTGFDFSAARIVASVEESLVRLQTDYLDVLLAHDIEFARPEQIIHETLPAMHSLKQTGRVHFVGITGYPLHLLKAVAEVVELDVILSYCHYNLMDTTLDVVLTPLVRQKNLGLINASPLHMGLLTKAGAPAWHPAPKRVVEAGRQVAELCRRRGVDIATLALQFALQNEAVATTLVGMSQVSEVKQNLSVIGIAPNPELLAEVRAVIEPVANLVWQEGRPENYSPGAVEKQS
jgi:L-galactose dehydrogenase